MPFYAVTMPKAHVGFDHKQEITFAFRADSALEAMFKAQRMGGVKHNKVPTKCVQITETEYKIRREQSAYMLWKK